MGLTDLFCTGPKFHLLLFNLPAISGRPTGNGEGICARAQQSARLVYCAQLGP